VYSDAENRNAMAKATFAAGCFWGVEAAFRKVPGVLDTAVGFTGGALDGPSYEEVCNIHDPTTQDRQGPDVGTQYRSAIYYHTDEQEETAEESKKKLERSGHYWNPVVTEIAPATEFYTAEEYHQKYYDKRGLE
jgi:peptide-methionine (S)-S-oxide reductase